MRRSYRALLFLLSACIVATVTQSTTAQADSASWIWHPQPKGAAHVPAGTWYFRRHLAIPNDGPVKTATCSITADNAFVLFINGKKVGSGDNWQNVCSFDAKPFLSPGTNVLAVEAVNWDGPGENPAGMIASLRVTFGGGRPLVVPTDGGWKSSSTSPDWC